MWMTRPTLFVNQLADLDVAYGIAMIAKSSVKASTVAGAAPAWPRSDHLSAAHQNQLRAAYC